MADLEEKILEDNELQSRIWWKYIDDIFFIWKHGEDSLKQFIETLNSFLIPLSNSLRNGQKKK